MKPPESVVRATLIKAADTPINFELLKTISDFALNEERGRRRLKKFRPRGE